MTTSVHREARIAAEQNRRVALTLLVSLLLHTPLFVSQGSWRLASLSETSAPALEVRVELEEAKEAEEDTPRENVLPNIAELTTPALEPREAFEPSGAPVERLDERVPAAEPRLQASEATVPNESPALSNPAFAETRADVLGDELTLIEPEPTPPTEAVVAAFAPAQQAVLTRRLLSEAHELLDTSSLQRRVTFEDRNREFTAVLTRRPAVDGTGIERVTVEITTGHGGERVHTSMQMKRLAFSHFTQLVDRWDPDVQLHDDEIVGRFHSNSRISLSYDDRIAPRLLGKVTTARGIRIDADKAWRPRRKIFAGGLETRAARVRLPDIALPVAHEHATGDADMHVVGSDTLIVFHADGGYDCIDVSSRAKAQRRLAPDKPTYIIGAADAALYVRGVVNGNVTVYSPERIVVQGDLTYAHDARTGRDADGYLGLVSDGNVEIDRPDVTGPGDLEIHAALYARKRFFVRSAHARGGGALLIYGSLTAGSISETEPRYATRIEFDPRFERARPPGFPETDRYEIEMWDGTWRVAGEPARE